ncbi:hypothetical protein [Fluviicola sp.]|uniref:hypothetical protein n=1 Tax=Fluviicola sp. TaxID=1917219 RepID=UPI0031D61D87
MEGWEYVVFSSYIFPIGMGLALLIQKRLPFIGKILWVYMLFRLCVEIVSFILARNGINNLWLYRVYLYAELVFPSIFFFNQFSRKGNRLLLLIAFVLAITLTTLTNLFDNWLAHASVQTGIAFVYVAFIIISYFVEMFRMEKVFNPFKDVYFILGAVIFLGHSGSLIYDVLYNYLISGYFGSGILSILNKVNLSLIIFYNVLYSYALWISRHHPT